MIIEFIGSTGAGKTTLISEVQRRLAQTIEVATSFDVVASPLGLRRITHLTVRNLIQELVGFPFFIGSLYRHKALIVFILRMLARQASFSFFTINNLRSLERKIGVYEIIKRRQHDEIILVDEGLLLLAHNVFVYSSAYYSYEEIATFASLVPLPDIIIYIKAPIDILIQRSLLRTDPPREMKSRNRELIEKHINRAIEMFDQLIAADNIQCRLLIVENHDSNHHGYHKAVDDIVEFILNYELADKTVNAASVDFKGP
jgi:thymidylate kinase